jgi:hypothetical protein
MRAIGIMKTTVTTTTGDAGKFQAMFSRARPTVDRAPVFASPMSGCPMRLPQEKNICSSKFVGRSS